MIIAMQKRAGFATYGDSITNALSDQTYTGSNSRGPSWAYFVVTEEKDPERISWRWRAHQPEVMVFEGFIPKLEQLWDGKAVTIEDLRAVESGDKEAAALALRIMLLGNGRDSPPF